MMQTVSSISLAGGQGKTTAAIALLQSKPELKEAVVADALVRLRTRKRAGLVKLIATYGFTTFVQMFKLVNMNLFVRSIVDRSVAQRMGELYKPK